jgi:hypothetical protein
MPTLDAGRFGTYYGVSPDGSPLFLRNTGFQEIYALDVDLPNDFGMARKVIQTQFEGCPTMPEVGCNWYVLRCFGIDTVER